MAEELRSVGETQLLDLITSNIILTLPPSFYVFDTMELHMELHTLSRQWSTWLLDCLKRSKNWTREVKVFQIRPGVTISLWKCSNYPTYEDEDIKKQKR